MILVRHEGWQTLGCAGMHNTAPEQQREQWVSFAASFIRELPFHALQNQHLYRLLRHSRLSAFQTFVQQSLDGFLVKCERRRGRRQPGTCKHVTVGRTPRR